MVKYEEPFERLITQGMVLKKWVSIRKLLEGLGLDENATVGELLEKLKERGYLRE